MHFTNPLLVLSGLITVSLSQDDFSASSLEASLSSLMAAMPTNAADFKCGGETCQSGVCINGICQGTQSISCKDNNCVTISTSCGSNGVCSTVTSGSAAAPTMNSIQAAAGIAGFMGVALAL